MGKKVVVFGGSGFLGSYVSDALTDGGYEVKIFDRVHSPYLKDQQEMIVGDLMDLESVKKIIRGCTYVFNFAGIADIGEAKSKPVETTAINVLGNTHILEACRLAKVERFIFASTVYVFSDSGSFYRASKQACERFIEAYHEQFNLNYTILRYGSLYGRRAAAWNGIYTLLKQALESNKLIYDGNCESMREYVHVKDAAKLSVKILGDEYVNKHIIITGNERLAVKSLIKMIAEMVPHKIETEFLEKKVDGHYTMSPYSFNPRIGNKLTSNEHIDIGQGLLDCMAEIYEQVHHKPFILDGLIVTDKDNSN